jgi:prolyl-tRNA editing enzyme YbaK/EbsC (Cys-tRNA(Pro) deacylase)
MLFENTKNAAPSAENPRYVMMIVQYVARLHNEKITKVVHKHICQGKGTKKNFNWRVAPEAVSAVMTGYGHNAVVPIGMAEPVPILLSHSIAALPFFYLGGGHVDVKWRISTDDFQRACKPIVGDITYAAGAADGDASKAPLDD